MADISQEINDFKNAIYGEEVRGSMISLAEKLNTEVESNTTNVNQAVETANTASTAANQAVQDANTTLQAANQAVTYAAGSASAAAGSASAAAEHATDAEESATAAANSATAAAQSAAEAAEAAEGLEGFNGQASSVKAEDTEGLVGTAGGQTNVQALIDYIADQVKNQLVSDSALTTKLAKYILKSQIINNLLATQAGNVLDATQGKALSDMIGDTSSLPGESSNVVGAINQLNSDYYVFHLINSSLSIQTSTEKKYTGLSITIPANSICFFNAIANYNNSPAKWIGIGESNSNVASCIANANSGFNHACCTYAGNTNSQQRTLYAWAQYGAVASNMIELRGFYATKKTE